MWSWEERGKGLGALPAEMCCSLIQEHEKLWDEASYRFKGHREPADLSAVHSHCSMRELPREQVGFREGATLRMEQRQNR